MQNYRGIKIDRTSHSYILSDDAFTDLLTKDKSKVDKTTTQTYPSERIERLKDGGPEVGSWASCGAEKDDLQRVAKRIRVESERGDSDERLGAETSKENGISDEIRGPASFKNCHSDFLSNELSEIQNQSAAVESSSG